MDPTEQHTESRTCTVQEAAQKLGVNHKGLYAAIAEGRFPHIKIGRRILISRRILDRILDGEETLPAL